MGVTCCECCRFQPLRPSCLHPTRHSRWAPCCSGGYRPTTPTSWIRRPSCLWPERCYFRYSFEPSSLLPESQQLVLLIWQLICSSAPAARSTMLLRRCRVDCLHAFCVPPSFMSSCGPRTIIDLALAFGSALLLIPVRVSECYNSVTTETATEWW
jgi:hypothetical protein